MNPVVQIDESFLPTGLILLPGHSVHSRRGFSPQGVKAVLEQIRCHMVKQVRELLLFVFSRSLAHTMQSLGHPFPALCRASARFHGVLLGQRPSLPTSVTDVPIDVVRRLRRYYAAVRLLARVHARITLLASRAGPAPVGPERWRGLSVLARAVSWLAYGSPTTPDPEELAFSSPRFCLPAATTRSASGIRFSKLNSSLASASIYASPATSQCLAQDSRSRWFATPFLWGSFIPGCTPVYPDAFGRLRLPAQIRGGELLTYERAHLP